MNRTPHEPRAIPGRPRGRLPFAPEGWPFLATVAVGAALCLWQGWTTAFALLTALLAFMLNFFRDPERNTPQGEGLFIAPADGKVVRCERQGEVLRIDIFMNVFDVHVNRAPMSGRITDIRYTPGRFVNASFDSASTENERNRIEMTTDDGDRIAFTQIAGLVARRIVDYVEVGDHVRAGQRIGMIRFGSRVDCEIPADFVPRVQVGQRVRAGETVLAGREADA
ncbi:MAG: phosphatidylserine decarboxylase family protein [Mariprofundaceae bacterium]